MHWLLYSKSMIFVCQPTTAMIKEGLGVHKGKRQNIIAVRTVRANKQGIAELKQEAEINQDETYRI